MNDKTYTRELNLYGPEANKITSGYPGAHPLKIHVQDATPQHRNPFVALFGHLHPIPQWQDDLVGTTDILTCRCVNKSFLPCHGSLEKKLWFLSARPMPNSSSVVQQGPSN